MRENNQHDLADTLTTIISNFYDALKTFVAAQLTNAKLIVNPYALQSTSSLYLTNGFAIQVGPGTREPGDISCQMRMQREFVIILTRQITATEHDATLTGTVEKAVLEDQFTLIKQIELNNAIGGVSDIAFVSDSGLELLATQDAAGRFYVLSSLFRGTYLEQLN